jgi:hypothetical protein
MERAELLWSGSEATEKQKGLKVTVEEISIHESLSSSNSSTFEGTTQRPTKASAKQAYLGANFRSSDGWTWEILMLGLSLASFAALIVMLSVYQGKSTPQLPLDITFNAIISTLATISKSAALLVVAASMSQYKWLLLRDTKQDCNLRDVQLIDDASRGLWGSIKLLPCIRNRWVITLGAITTIASIAMEPLVQQVPSFTVETLRTQTELANVSRALSWMAEGELFNTSSMNMILTRCSQ